MRCFFFSRRRHVAPSEEGPPLQLPLPEGPEEPHLRPPHHEPPQESEAQDRMELQEAEDPPQEDPAGEEDRRGVVRGDLHGQEMGRHSERRQGGGVYGNSRDDPQRSLEFEDAVGDAEKFVQGRWNGCNRNCSVSITTAQKAALTNIRLLRRCRLLRYRPGEGKAPKSLVDAWNKYRESPETEETIHFRPDRYSHDSLFLIMEMEYCGQSFLNQCNGESTVMYQERKFSFLIPKQHQIALRSPNKIGILSRSIILRHPLRAVASAANRKCTGSVGVCLGIRTPRPTPGQLAVPSHIAGSPLLLHPPVEVVHPHLQCARLPHRLHHVPHTDR
ncbi:hypothetical protein CEXT_732451 [Caerostris extrusa]|uniref:Uncharacterized protein n=1 Tax=Caerostris extrusa TaxID=172846 RepID=A0AAV4QXX8_CAEEX|nr:hypothetical protein CEXT_732451 [Caerostris extrusa]